MKHFFKALLLALLCLLALPACLDNEPKLYPAQYGATLDVPGGKEYHSVNILDEKQLIYYINIYYDTERLKPSEQSLYPNPVEHTVKGLEVKAHYKRQGNKIHLVPLSLSAKDILIGTTRDIEHEAFIRDYNISIPTLTTSSRHSEAVLLLERFGQRLTMHRTYD